MTFASRQTTALVSLAAALARHEGVSVEAISGRAMGKGRFFAKLEAGSDCRTATAERVLDWFDAVWPSDLDWACAMPRPSGRPAAAYLVDYDAEVIAEVTNAPIWPNGRRPAWWHDVPVRTFLTQAHRQMSLLRAEKIGAEKFGDRCPKKSAIHLYWQRLDRVFGHEGAA
ncbi:hypothetical protein [Maritimibacter sp. HL-12]|uniref:hypothetical protein n=1 Tax=Maritimibacter sp. HL-12 TaxID=1162418 RepID=UPI000A0F314A|nr:hypothetical protein [Maritimibacter sp. HL-12]SMH36048.1 hypothetical protein SAMN05661107_0684 [Maritimibacter sp. HL-12]